MNNKNKNNKTSYIFTKETLGMTLMLFSAIVFLMLLTGKAVFGPVGTAICTFMYGTFGYGSYLVIGLLAYLGEVLVFEKKIKVPFKLALAISLTVLMAFFLFHAASSRNLSVDSYGNYIKDCYISASKGYAGYTFGGVISALIVYPFAKFTTFIGAYVIFSLLTVLGGYFIYFVVRRPRFRRKEAINVVTDEVAETEVAASRSLRTSEVPLEQMYEQSEIRQPREIKRETVSRYEPVQDDEKYSRKNLNRKILFEKGEFAAESYRRNLIFNENSYFNRPINVKDTYLNNFTDGKATSVPQDKSYSESYQEDVLNQPVTSAPTNYVYGDKPVENINDFEQVSSGVYQIPQEAVEEDYLSEPVSEPVEEVSSSDSEEIYSVEQPVEEEVETEQFTPPVRQESSFSMPVREAVEKREEVVAEEKTEPLVKEEKPVDKAAINLANLFSASNPALSDNAIEPDTSRMSSRMTSSSKADLFDYSDDDDDDMDGTGFSAFGITPGSSSATREVKEVKIERPAVQPAVVEETKQEEKPKHVWKKYVRPTLDLLDDYPESNNVNTGEIDDNKRTIVETLTRFKISSEVSNVIIGPAVTRYDVIIEDKTKIKQSLNYREAIAMALMKENVTAYLNFSKGALSIEVPNNRRAIVGLKSMLASPAFINSKSNTITFALGKNVEGDVMCPDITKMPHLLVAGTTGSGKSICLSSLLISLLYKYGPEELRLILVDPKQVEFISYDKLPHLMINEIISDVDKAIKALNWAIKEMERRYSLFKDMTENGIATKNLDEYNAHIAEGEEKLPKIVIILDEFGDLMLQAKKDIESRIIKLVQKARACGIHLILATQRPSVDCITGLIKSNLPTRIGFKVNSFDDARTIFDVGGAEKLLGKGDLYFRSAEKPELSRIQGCFVDTHEVQKVTDFVKSHNETYFDQSVSDFINTVEVEESPSSMSEDGGAESEAKIDETFIKALKYCINSNQASVSMIQRRFPVGYIKACKIIDWMENMNYITHSEGSKPRKILLTREDFIKTYGDIDD